MEKDLNELAKELEEIITQALDIVAPKKTFSIKPTYIHGLTTEAREIMKSRDYIRSQLKMVRVKTSNNQTVMQQKQQQ